MFVGKANREDPEAVCQGFFGKHLVFEILESIEKFYPLNLYSIITPFDTFEISCTVKTLYNLTLYNRILNIRHKIAGNWSASI